MSIETKSPAWMETLQRGDNADIAFMLAPLKHETAEKAYSYCTNLIKFHIRLGIELVQHGWQTRNQPELLLGITSLITAPVVATEKFIEHFIRVCFKQYIPQTS